MSFTWNPRLVKTPTPTMSATTIAVAVTVVTVGRTALLAVTLMLRPTPCPHAFLPSPGWRSLLFILFYGFSPPKTWPRDGRMRAMAWLFHRRDIGTAEVAGNACELRNRNTGDWRSDFVRALMGASRWHSA